MKTALLFLLLLLLLCIFVVRKFASKKIEQGVQVETQNANGKKKRGFFWFLGPLLQTPESIKTFDFAGLIVRAIALVAVEVVIYHFNPVGLWTMLTNNFGQGGWKTLTVLNTILVTSIILASFPKGEKGKDKTVHGVAKWIRRLVILIVVVMLFREKLPEITKPMTYAPVTITCAPGEWSVPYTIKTVNIHADTSEGVYWVRINKDPSTVYKAEPGKSLQIPPYPKVRIVEWKCDRPMEVTVTEKP
jgi:hypothetical protein